ncbi:Lipase 1 [Pseudidiomarina piscicola]|uniref:Lipase 1 n=1 Tax=Pseudidiomarina piscicola TaxID=2614830 RepID=A0A6S6WMM8_9GAMM|nr:alpha/beta fold hydrolase [Pseudidiomarina piscicola]CAB0151328.1 Lipase 1 [Pseudidiomarina piscicola]VZT40809.1 Lipase 1 [Pseudomonas aeruginosa]
MFKVLSWAALLVTSILLSGCANYVEYELSKRPQGMQWENESEASLRTLELSKREFCLPYLGGCTGYYFGKPYHLLDTDKSFARLTFNAELEVNGQVDTSHLDLQREQVAPRSGTVVLLHGYGGDKSSMGYLAAYYMFLGYHVVVPDLLGHGDSSAQQVGFGVRDAAFINTLIDSLPAREVPHPLYLAGVSMGAVAAAHVAKNRDDVSGLMLFAPMRPMDQATTAMVELLYPNLSKVMPTESIREGVLAAMRKQDVAIEDTDLRKLLPAIQLPTLVIASDKDAIAPYDYYLPLESDRLQLIMAPGRHHMSLGVMDNERHEHVRAWLDAVEK